MRKPKKQLTLNLERIPGKGPRPLHIKFDVTLPENDPRQEAVLGPLGAFLAALLSDGEAEELLRQFKEQLPAQGTPKDCEARRRE